MEDVSHDDTNATLFWDAPLTWADGTPLSVDDIGGYKIYYGTSSGNYTDTLNVGKVTTYPFSNISGGTYYITVTAYDLNGTESDYSNEIVKVLQ